MSDPMAIVKHSLSVLIQRDIQSLRDQVEAYPDDDSLWLVPAGITNSAGNLALHLCGNLRHFIGGTLGETGYVRTRELEFSRRGLSRAELVAEIDATIEEVQAGFDKLSSPQLAADFPAPIPDTRMVSMTGMIVHLASHLTYHLGQIDYHRRLLTVNPATVDMLSIKFIPVSKPA